MLESKQSWKFAYEALTHVHLLRLFVFNSDNSVPLRCDSLRAYLQPKSPFSSSPVVVCEWRSPAGETHTIFVPKPFCLIDHSASFSVVSQDDHIEVKMKLLNCGGNFKDGLAFLGYSYASTNIEGGAMTESEKRDDAPLSLAADVELLAMRHDLCFYCRNCSARLTTQPLRHVQELPSVEWREIAEHWFGTCCCSNAAQTDTLLARFAKCLTPIKGVCLVGSTTCITHLHDLVGSIGDQHHSDSGTSDLASGASDAGDGAVERDTDIEVKYTVNGGNQLEDDFPPTINSTKISVSSDDVGSLGKKLEHTLCISGCGAHHGEVKRGLSEDLMNVKIPNSGFMSETRSPSSSTQWTPFSCRSCSCLVGASEGEGDTVQLFKCYISTDAAPGGPSDVFRYHTLERVFCSELLSKTEQNSSYRYVIRGLNNKKLLLQLVILNHESWSCSGTCLGELGSLLNEGDTQSLRGGGLSVEGEDNDSLACPREVTGVAKEELCPAVLEPVLKVMFRDASAFSCEELSAAEDWATKQQADDMYMLESEAKALAESLHKNKNVFPKAWGSLQQFNVSFLVR